MKVESVKSVVTPYPPSIGIVVPTYREVENIPLLVNRLRALREKTGWKIDLLFMDDDSKDGSDELVRSMDLPWVKMIVRTSDRGLSQAVLDGLRRSSADILVVMDCDLSHPPEKIPDLVHALENGADFAVGSRFAEGGSTDDDWGLFRWLNSRVATLLARPLTSIKDPMSGFFALRQSTFQGGREFNAIGYKIGLELFIKCHCIRPVEVPIHFSDRQFGNSKLSLKEQLRYLQHIRRLYIYKYGNWSHLIQFLVVGASGLVVNLILLTAFLAMDIPRAAAVAAAIFMSMLWNFALNRRFTFSYARNESIVKQFVGFASTSTFGALVNYLVTMSIWDFFHYNQVAAAIGVISGTAFNFVGSRYLVFRKTHFVPVPSDGKKGAGT